MNTWVYIKTEPQLWTVGFYDPHGEYQTDSDHSSPQAAAARVHYLNGGRDETLDVTEEQLDLLDRRNAVYQADPQNVVTWEEVKAKLSSNF